MAVALRLLGYPRAFAWKLRPPPSLRPPCHANEAPLQAWPFGAGCKLGLDGPVALLLWPLGNLDLTGGSEPLLKQNKTTKTSDKAPG